MNKNYQRDDNLSLEWNGEQVDVTVGYDREYIPAEPEVGIMHGGYVVYAVEINVYRQDSDEEIEVENEDDLKEILEEMIAEKLNNE